MRKSQLFFLYDLDIFFSLGFFFLSLPFFYFDVLKFHGDVSY